MPMVCNGNIMYESCDIHVGLFTRFTTGSQCNALGRSRRGARRKTSWLPTACSLPYACGGRGVCAGG